MAESKSAALPLGYTPPVPCFWGVLKAFATLLLPLRPFSGFDKAERLQREPFEPFREQLAGFPKIDI
jgi:hypothetical protein